MSRLKRRTRWEATFDPTRLALTGVALSIALLFQPSLTARTIMLALAALTAWASGRRLSFLMTIVVMVGIVGANLLVPIGRKLVSIGPFSITEIALLDGLQKAVTFEALMFISKACLGPGLSLPGTFGAFFADALRGYDRILERKPSVKAGKGFIKSVDEILVSVYDEFSIGSENSDTSRRHPSSALRPSDMALAGTIIVAMLAIFLG